MERVAAPESGHLAPRRPPLKRLHPAPVVESLDDACLVRILACLTPMPDRFNAGRVCKRWARLASDRRLWLRVEGGDGEGALHGRRPDAFDSLQEAVAAARPGDTILIAAGQSYSAHGIKITKPLCLLGGGKTHEETVLVSPRGFEGALEFHANARVANLTVIAQLGSCLLHRRGRLVVENCALECAEHPLEHLVCPIVSTALGGSGGGGGSSGGGAVRAPGLPLLAHKSATDTSGASSPRSVLRPPPPPLHPPPPHPLPLRGDSHAPQVQESRVPSPPLRTSSGDRLLEGGGGDLCASPAAELPQQRTPAGDGGSPAALPPLPAKAAGGASPGGPLQERRGADGCGGAPAAAHRGFSSCEPLDGGGARHPTSDGVDVVETRIGGGLGAVRISGGLALRQVRVLYARAALVFWFTLAQQQPQHAGPAPKGAPAALLSL